MIFLKDETQKNSRYLAQVTVHWKARGKESTWSEHIYIIDPRTACWVYLIVDHKAMR